MDYLILLSQALLGSVIALIGGFVFLFNKKLSSSSERYSIPFAAGVLVTVSLVGLIPEAHHLMGENANWVVLISFLLVYLFEHLFFGIHHHDSEDHQEQINKSSVPLVIFGDTIHNFIDGVAIGASFMVNPSFGWVMAFSTFLHEVPHEIGDFGILLKAGWKRSKIILVNVFSSLTTIIGAFSVYVFSANDNLNGILMAISAGIFMYLGASDFLPKIRSNEKSKFKSIAPLLFGVIIISLVLLLVNHEH